MIVMDQLDARILLALDDDPDASVLALARRLGIARNTLTARLARMQEAAVLGPFSRRVEPASLGLGLTAFISVELSQEAGEDATAALRQVPEVIEMHAITGEADLLLKVVAGSTADLHRLNGRLLAIPAVRRTSTAISLAEEMPLRLRGLLARAAAGST